MDPHRRRPLLAAALVVGLTGCTVPMPSAAPASTSAAPSTPASVDVSFAPPPASADAAAAAARIAADLASLQAIADANQGIRAAGTPGYEASVDHAAASLRDIGFEVTTPEIAFTAFRDDGATLEVGGRTFSGPDEVRALIYSPGGEVSGRVVHLEESGCQPADFEAVEPGDLALTTQGGCFRRDQVLNAVDAGAAALLVGYPGRGPGEIFRPTLIDPGGMDIPAVSVTDEAVELLTGPGGDEARLTVATELPPSTFRNVIGQLGDGPRVVMVGAHLDSVLDGPGINDNGSGVAAVLEIARGVATAGLSQGWALRIGLWGAEELGSIGSRAYAETVGADVVAYLNLDMAGSVNGTTLVYDEEGAAPGSGAITEAFEAVLAARDEDSEGADLGGSSDHFGFTQAGIPTGGLFAGATETGGAAAPSAVGGGTAPDPCYHIGCDDLDNVDVDRVVLFAEVTTAVVVQLMAAE
jgi:Zn-dependent M28 family amino/carboxypeptidase